jgi:hypothetical protein
MITPSLLVPWLIASVAVLGLGAAVTAGSGEPVIVLLAPAVAVVGIAYAYGPGVDPAWELSQSMAISDRMVLLVRALAVFVVDSLLGLLASSVSGLALGITFEWLVPMTAMSALALAAATVARSANVGVAAGLAGWVITMLSGRAAAGHFTVAVTASVLVLPYLAFAGCCVAVVAFATRLPRRSA